MISFKAHNISNINISNSRSKVRDYSVNFVEFSPFFEKDMDTLKQISFWDNGESLSNKIYKGAEHELLRGNPWHKFYGLVNQYDSFEKIKPENVLGVMDICPIHEELHELNLIQVNPIDNLFSKCRRYTEVGTAMLDSIKSLFLKKDILVEPLTQKEVIGFYVKNGFVDIGDGLYKYIAKVKK